MSTDKTIQSGTASSTGAISNGDNHAPDLQELQEEIRATRAELGGTVAELAAKADVKARTRNGVTAATDRAKDTVQQVNETVRRRPVPLVIAALAALAAAGAVGLIKLRAARTRGRSWQPWSR